MIAISTNNNQSNRSGSGTPGRGGKKFFSRLIPTPLRGRNQHNQNRHAKHSDQTLTTLSEEEILEKNARFFGSGNRNSSPPRSAEESKEEASLLDDEMQRLIQTFGQDACKKSLQRCSKIHRRHSADAGVNQNFFDSSEEMLPEEAAQRRRSSSRRLSIALRMSGDASSYYEGKMFTNSILEASLDGLFMTDELGIVQRTNHSAVKMFGYECRDQLLGQHISMVILGAEGQQGGGVESMMKMAAGQHPKEQEEEQEDYGYGDCSYNNYQYAHSQEQQEAAMESQRQDTGRCQDGREFPVQVANRILTVGGKRFYVTYCHDLTEHVEQLRQLEQEKVVIQKEQRLNKSILDSSFDAIFLFDSTGLITQVNACAIQVLGYEAAHEILGQNMSILFADGGRSLYQDKQHRARRRSGISHGASGTFDLNKSQETTGRRKNGTDFPCRVGLKKVPHTDLIVGFLRDISNEKVALQAQLEKQAAEELLLNMLPQEIAIRLQNDPSHIADHYPQATIVFADLVGFTRLSNSLEPVAVVQFLNKLFTRFDECLETYDLNKIKTIGDCYMVASIPPGDQSPQDSCSAVCHFALDMIQQLNEYNQENPDQQLNLRIGINTGPVVAGIVGTKRFLYDVWGDAVNLASRMESTGIPGRIQVTQSVVDLARAEFDFEKRDSPVQVKGIGEMETYLIKGRLDCPIVVDTDLMPVVTELEPQLPQEGKRPSLAETKKSDFMSLSSHSLHKRAGALRRSRRRRMSILEGQDLSHIINLANEKVAEDQEEKQEDEADYYGYGSTDGNYGYGSTD